MCQEEFIIWSSLFVLLFAFYTSLIDITCFRWETFYIVSLKMLSASLTWLSSLYFILTILFIVSLLFRSRHLTFSFTKFSISSILTQIPDILSCIFINIRWGLFLKFLFVFLNLSFPDIPHFIFYLLIQLRSWTVFFSFQSTTCLHFNRFL